MNVMVKSNVVISAFEKAAGFQLCAIGFCLRDKRNVMYAEIPKTEVLKELNLLLMRERGTETLKLIQKRLRNARAELHQSNEPDLFDHLSVNDDLVTCYENLKRFLSLDDTKKIQMLFLTLMKYFCFHCALMLQCCPRTCARVRA
ncbi:uncharacterized protein [Miscanthus floridulus]|uniref:uncharacterized protein n=1 Tax=Miscanthus floridulus TaxID=154761 RepID=UPI00345855E7